VRSDVTFGLAGGLLIGIVAYLRGSVHTLWWIPATVLILGVAAGVLGWIFRQYPSLYRSGREQSPDGRQRPRGDGDDDAGIDQP
jgi:hypothetical protein